LYAEPAVVGLRAACTGASSSSTRCTCTHCTNCGTSSASSICQRCSQLSSCRHCRRRLPPACFSADNSGLCQSCATKKSKPSVRTSTDDVVVECDIDTTDADTTFNTFVDRSARHLPQDSPRLSRTSICNSSLLFIIISTYFDVISYDRPCGYCLLHSNMLYFSLQHLV